MRAWTAGRLGVGAFGLACVGAAARMVATGQGKHVMDEIRGVIDQMRAEEAGLLVERRAVAAREARLTTATTLGGLAVAFGLLVVAGLLLNGAVVERERE